jgi:hypothetical protein
MPIPEPEPRKLLHLRDIGCQGYLREDGLWDIEAELRDVKTYTYEDRERGRLPAGKPMHGMKARITVDNDLVVRDAHAEMTDIPFRYCEGAIHNIAGLIGATVGAGWRHAVNQCMPGVAGCSHFRELLYVVATVAFQTVSAYREQYMQELGAPKKTGSDVPFFLDQCHSWDTSSPVVMRFMPEFYKAKRNGDD